MGNQYISKGITPQFLKCAGVSCWLLYRLSNGQNREVVQGSKRIQPVRPPQPTQRWSRRLRQQGHESESHSWKPCYCHRKHWYWWQYWACPLSSRNSPPCYYWPSKLRGLPIRQQQGDIAALYPKFTPAQIRLPKQFVLLGPTPNHLTRSQRNTHTYWLQVQSQCYRVRVSLCGGDEVLMALLPEKNASLPIGTMPPAFWSRAKRSLIWPLVLTM